MKRLICLALCLVLALCGCTAVTENKEKLQVVTTIFPAYDFARQIGGERAEVTMLLPPGGEVHAYEPSVQDMARIRDCDVFIYNGGEGDGWVEALLTQCDTSDKQVIRMMDHVDLIMTGEDHHQHGHDHAHTHEEADEHIWTTPENAILLTEAIGKGLMMQDPANEGDYQRNLTQLRQQLDELVRDYRVLEQHNHACLVVADRFPFSYMAHGYNLSYVAAFDGCTSNTEASLETVYELTLASRESGSRTILYTEFSDRVLAETVARGVGGTTRLWHSCHNVTKDEWASGVTYVALMKQNLVTLKEALGL